MEKELLLQKINERNAGTLMQTLGIEFVDMGDDYLEAKLPVIPAVLQPDGVLHGGATAALAETVGSSAAAVFCRKEGQMLRGIEISASHVRGVRSGYVTARATALHMGRTMQLWDIQIKNDEGQLVSSCKLTTITLSK